MRLGRHKWQTICGRSASRDRQRRAWTLVRALRRTGAECESRRDQPWHRHDGCLGLPSLPATISGTRDDGNLPFHFEPPAAGGHLRVVQSTGKPPDYDPAKDPACKPLGPTRLRPDGVWDRGGQNLFSSPVHKSATVDYGILLEGERTLLLDRGNVVMRAGDIVVQLGNWHGWTNVNGASLMAFVMMGAKFEREPKV